MFYAPSLDYYVVTRYADVEAGLPRQRDLLRRQRAAPARASSCPRRQRSCSPAGTSRSRRWSASTSPPTPACAARRPGVHAEPVDGDGADDPRDARRAARRVDARDRFDLVEALTFPLPATIDLHVHGRAGRGRAAAQGVVRRRAASPGDARRRTSRSSTRRSMAAYRGYLRGLVAAQGDGSAATTSRARCSRSTTRTPTR